MSNAAEQIVCPQCGMTYEYDPDRRCWQCDGAACPHCMPEDGPEPLCAECRFGPLPAHVEPMLAVNGKMPRDPSRWAFEYKWDGMRALCYIQGGCLRFESRKLRDVTFLYPDLVEEAALPEMEAIVDGEIIALDQEGRPSFKRLQRRMHASPRKVPGAVERTAVHYYVFDLLWYNGRSVMDQPYLQRREALQKLHLPHPRWQVPASHVGEGKAMLRVARQWGLEGLVAKRPDGPYRAGQRSGDWQKIKIVRRGEFVVGGWEPREKNSRQVGSLLLGYYHPDRLGLQYAGRVGTGFDAETHQRLASLLEQHPREESPFEGRVGGRSARFVEPIFVAAVDYRRWPAGGNLQQASFQGLRADVSAHDVLIERED
ncbi:MAG: non-homologous end-joining DNA ligase [Phycisphaerae bacterium]